MVLLIFTLIIIITAMQSNNVISSHQLILEHQVVIVLSRLVTDSGHLRVSWIPGIYFVTKLKSWSMIPTCRLHHVESCREAGDACCTLKACRWRTRGWCDPGVRMTLVCGDHDTLRTLDTQRMDQILRDPQNICSSLWAHWRRDWARESRGWDHPELLSLRECRPSAPRSFPASRNQPR